ncbi:MAG: hypothetical protein II369_06130 [Clostridia bacterium]|nr:hypothetical protein [Clostridia bacterium]
MIKRLSNSKWLIIRHGVSVVVVFAMLVVALVAISPDLSFGWFTQNDTVSANGMSVQAQHNDLTVYYQVPDANGAWTTAWVAIDENTDTSVLFAKIKAPGDEATFRIKVVSASATTLSGFGFAAPSGPSEEAPVWEGSTAHYLSTELYTSLLKINNTAVSDPPEIYFRDGNGTKQINLLAGQDPIELAENQEVIFELKVGFFNSEEPQNVFKNYQENGGVFARRFFFTFGDS